MKLFLNRSMAAALTLSLAVTGCFGDGEGVSSSNAKGAGNSADGTIGDGAGTLGDTTGGDATATDAQATDSSSSLAKSCQTNADCAAEQHCGLFYNGVQELTGDDDGKGGKLLPGWANVCVKTDTKLAQVGEKCDPFSSDDDKSLPTCHNMSTCQQGTCTSLCKVDADCASGTVCGASEVPIEVKDKGQKTWVFLMAQVCIPAAGSGTSCSRNADCGTTEICRSYLAPAAGKLQVKGKCVAVESGKQPVGGSCGAKSSATGLGKLCGSALCQYTGNGTVAGVCTATCNSKADCPATLTYGAVAYKTACSSFLSATNDPTDTDDDTFIPQCILVHQNSSMKDCAKTRTCDGTEACIAFAVARGPGQGTKVEHLCVEQATKQQPQGPPKSSGESCDPNAATPQCAGGYCIKGASGNYCSKTCVVGGCPAGLKCADHVLIARPGTAAAATTLCKK